MLWYLVQTGCVIGLAVIGVFLGRWFSRLKQFWWALGYFIPLLPVAMISLARWIQCLEFQPPFRWLMAGRTEFALMAPIVAMLLTTPLSRLPLPRQRRMVSIFMICFVAYFSITPFLAPVFNQRLLRNLPTFIDKDGVCLQGTSYTCGPASTVTALAQLGLQAEEGNLALLAYTTDLTGTPVDLLCEAIKERFGIQGICCHYQYFNTIGEMKGHEPVIAVVRFGFLVDHFVAVLKVTGISVIIGDPLVGRETLTYDQFNARWRNCGIVIQRNGGAMTEH